MTAAFVVAAAAAVLALVALVLTARQGATRLAAAEARANRLEAQLASVSEAGAQPEGPASLGDETHQAQTDPALPADDTTPGDASGLIAAGPLWELERLRLEREWADVAGPSAPLPVPWDGTLRSVVAIELDIIREVVGTPSLVESAPAAPTSPLPSTTEPNVAMTVAASRLVIETLRRMAKAGEEITVSFETDTDVTMSIATDGAGLDPDLSGLTEAAAGFGGQLALMPTASGFVARLRLPPDPSVAS